MRLEPSNKVLSQRLAELLATAPSSRLKLADRMHVSDGTLGRIKYGQANATLDVVDRIATFFRVEPWTLIKPGTAETQNLVAQLSSLATPRSRAALDAIARAAEEGRLTDDDLRLLQHIAERFMQG